MEKIVDYLISARFIGGVIIAVLALLLCIVMRKAVSRYLSRFSKEKQLPGKKETYLKLSVNLSRFLITLIAVMFILQINGVNVTSLITGLGIVGVVVGLAMQDGLKDFIMGYNIISNNFFLVGDVIRYGDTVGVVIDFSLKATKIKDINTGAIFTVCNRNVSEITKVSDWLDIIVPTEYESDPATITTFFTSLLPELKAVKHVKECAFLGTDKLDGSSVNYRFRAFVPPQYHPEVRRKLLGIIYRRMCENCITVPFEQLDIHNK